MANNKCGQELSRTRIIKARLEGFAEGAVDGAMATADGVIPFADPFADAGLYDRCDPTLMTSRFMGTIARDSLLMAAGVGFGKFMAGKPHRLNDFSHFIPRRWGGDKLPKILGGPKSLWNGNYIHFQKHALTDPHRYRFMLRSFKQQNALYGPLRKWWIRTPWMWKGTAAGAGTVTAVRLLDKKCGCP